MTTETEKSNANPTEVIRFFCMDCKCTLEKGARYCPECNARMDWNSVEMPDMEDSESESETPSETETESESE